jgi:hypothetical protein
MDWTGRDTTPAARGIVSGDGAATTQPLWDQPIQAARSSWGSKVVLLLYEATLDRMEEAFHQLANMIDPPELVTRGSYHVFRYKNETAEAAIIQKLARVISGLRATLVLLRNGYVQEVGALCRMMDEFNEDIVFLCQAIGKDQITDLHQQYLRAFYENLMNQIDRSFLARRDL